MHDPDARADGPDCDPVTGCRPRAALRPYLDAVLAGTAETGPGRCSVFLFDVDFFKTVNDAYGHLRGDRVLRQLADQVRHSIRPTHALFRYGGDEFVVVLPGADRAEALRCALRLTDGIRDHEFAGEPPLRLSISLGVATSPEDGSGPDTVLACADRRNYLAKRRGRDCVVTDDVEPGGGSSSSRLWERDTELRACHEFLTRLQAGVTGALRVSGSPGAGHTRFLAEVATIAALRGFTVVPVAARPEGAGAQAPAAPAATPSASPAGASPAARRGPVLLIADVGARPRVPAAVAAARRAGQEVLGLVFAATDDARSTESAGLPVLDKIDLKPWSAPVLRIWLRSTLRGEPTRALLNWVVAESGGLPAAAVRAVERLRSRNGLVPSPAGGWTVSAAVLGRPARRPALPVPLTAMVGREAERDRVVRLLDAARLVTLVGTGGIGKTRLATAVATAVAERFDEGAVFVPLADTTGTDQVVEAIAQALRVTAGAGQTLLDAVAAHLSDASLLLLLDNFEQVVDSAPVVVDLLACAPGVTAMVTSRERLAVYGEQVYRVPPLPLPDLAALPAGAERVPMALASSPALTLFAQRARAAEPDFELTAEHLPTVAELCHRLDGLPLAIELVAARVDRWPPAELLTRLAGHLDVSSRGPRDRPVRQQTLRGAIGWSHALLAPADQALFETLAVFVGGADVPAARAVAVNGAGAGTRAGAGTGAGAGAGAGAATGGGAGGPGRGGLADRLELLVEKSLLVAENEPDGTDRYRLLETIRVFAADRLADRSDAAAVHDRHAGYFVAFAERCGEGMTGPEQAAWTERLERDYGNLRAALDWLLGRGDAASAARLCLGLWRYWRNGSNLSEGRQWLSRVLAARAPLPAEVNVHILYAAAVLAGGQGDHATASDLAGRSLRQADAAGNRPATAQAHNALGIAAIGAGDIDGADEHFRHSLEIWEEIGEAHGTAVALGNLTKIALRRGDVHAADGYTRRCLELERATGDTRGVVMALEAVGQIRLAQGDLPGARRALQESLELSRTLGDVFGEAMAMHWLGLAAQSVGDVAEALRLLTGALVRRCEVDDQEDLAVSLDRVAGLVLPEHPELAVRLLASAGELRIRHRLPEPPERETGRAATLHAARERLQKRVMTRAWEAGRSTPVQRLVDQVLDLVDQPL